jgi:hypothetical protein
VYLTTLLATLRKTQVVIALGLGIHHSDIWTVLLL